MNANTALKVNEAVEQAVRCGESEREIRETFETALQLAYVAKAARVLSQLRSAEA